MDILSEAHQDELQDIARSSYADMLNDVERNLAYQKAINLSVKTLVTSNKYNKDGNSRFKCCDIGTGSGLLSMMIVSSFRDLNYSNFQVTSFEAFEPMAKCAQEVIKRNKMSDHITVVSSRSDQFKDSAKFDLLVAELLDTELIGEGCLEVYRHAVENLCSQDCLFVPRKAHVYAEPIASPMLFARHSLDDRILLGGNTTLKLNLSEHIKQCNGISAIDDMQISSLRQDRDFKRITKAAKVFEFDFGSREHLKLHESVEVEFHVENPVEEPIVMVMWWDIIMYDDNVVQPDETKDEPDFKVLSCAPVWARDKELLSRDKQVCEMYGANVWREHWIQGIYYLGNVQLTKQLQGLRRGDTLKVYCYHDSFSMWFDLEPASEPARCTCGVHRKLSRSQLAFLSTYCDTLKKLISSSVNKIKLESMNLEGSVLFLDLCDQVARDIGEEEAKWKIDIINGTKTVGKLVDLCLTTDCDIIWAPLLRRFILGLNVDPIESFEIKFTPVKLEDLSRIRGPIGECCGYNLDALDELIETSTSYADQTVEAHFMCEYMSKKIGDDVVILSSDQAQLKSNGHDMKPLIVGRQIRFSSGEGADVSDEDELDKLALIFWIECKLQHQCDLRITSGYLLNRDLGSQDNSSRDQWLQWTRDCKQVVHFLKGCPRERLLKVPSSSSSSRLASSATTAATTNNTRSNKNNFHWFEYNVEIHISAKNLAVYHRGKNEDKLNSAFAV